MAQSISIDLYQQIEQQHGKELAAQFSKTVEAAFVQMEEQGKALAAQKKIELKDELTKELVTKAEFAGEMKALREEIKTLDARFQGELKTLRAELELKIERLDRKFTVMFIVLFFTTIFVNKETLSFFLRVIGVLK